MEARRTAIYVDGYNLYYGRLRDTPFKWLDLVALFSAILRVQDNAAQVQAVKFFTAPALARFASHGQTSVEAQHRYHRALENLYPDIFSITLGAHSMDAGGALLPTYQEGLPYDRNVRTRVWKIEEKKTDVNLAMAMYRDAAKGLFDQVVLCSNDSDAEPMLAALREDFAAIRIGVVTPVRPPIPGKGASRGFSTSLAQHADWVRRHILDEELQAAQLREVIPTGRKAIRKPAHW